MLGSSRSGSPGDRSLAGRTPGTRRPPAGGRRRHGTLAVAAASRRRITGSRLGVPDDRIVGQPLEVDARGRVPRCRPTRNGNAPLRQASSAYGQRGWKAQPGGTAARSGGAPGMGRGARARPSSKSGTLPSRPRVYGCRGSRVDLGHRPGLDDLARVHDRDPLAHLRHDRQVVRDVQERDAGLARGCAPGGGGSGPGSSRPGRWSARRRG